MENCVNKTLEKYSNYFNGIKKINNLSINNLISDTFTYGLGSGIQEF